MQAAPNSGPVRTWFCLVAFSHASKWFGREFGERVVPPGEADDAGAEQNFEADLRACLDDLAPLQRAVLTADLAAGGAVPARLLADQLKTTPNSVYVSRTLGRKALHAALQTRGLGRALTAAAEVGSTSTRP